jgi:AcrR family transcriptional regulator
MGKPGRPAGRSGEETKEKIISAAIELFSATSVDAASIRQIMRKIEMNEASFYNHFKSKDQLVEELIYLFKQKLQEQNNNTVNIKKPINTRNPKKYWENSFHNYMKKISAPSMERNIWFIISAEQYKRASAAECIIILTEQYISLEVSFIKKMVAERVLKRCNEQLLAEELIYGFRAMHLEYLMHSIHGMETDLIVTRVNRHIDFCLKPFLR